MDTAGSRALPRSRLGKEITAAFGKQWSSGFHTRNAEGQIQRPDMQTRTALSGRGGLSEGGGGLGIMVVGGGGPALGLRYRLNQGN